MTSIKALQNHSLVVGINYDQGQNEYGLPTWDTAALTDYGWVHGRGNTAQESTNNAWKEYIAKTLRRFFKK